MTVKEKLYKQEIVLVSDMTTYSLECSSPQCQESDGSRRFPKVLMHSASTFDREEEVKSLIEAGMDHDRQFHGGSGDVTLHIIPWSDDINELDGGKKRVNS